LAQAFLSSATYDSEKAHLEPQQCQQESHKIENFFRRVKDWGRIAARYDKGLYWIKL